MDTSAKLPALEVDNGSMADEGIQSPDLSKEGKPKRKAIKDQSQAWSIYNNLENDNRYRTSKNAEIVAREAGKPPRDPKDLQSSAQDWRSNFPTLALRGIKRRIAARLIRTIDNLRVITNARLPESVEGHDEKSKKFQDRVTSYIRRWDGWRPFISELASETVLIGNAVATLLDDYNWRVRLRRSDQAFLPQGAPQSPSNIQTIGIKESFMIHECVEWIEDKEAADVAGFQVDNVVKSTNKARPKNPLWDEQGQGNLSRAYQDLMLEGNLGMAYSTGAKGVDVAHLLVIEPVPDEEGKQITHYMLDRNDEHNALLIKEHRFEKMGDAICFFTLEPGNSTFHGSRGIGRDAVNITVAMDTAANDAVDAYRLSSLGVLKSDSKGGIATQIRMTNPFVIVTTDAELQQEHFAFNPEGFKALYGQLGMILENAVGEYLTDLPADPLDATKKHRTATGDRIDYQREQEQTIAFVARFLGQFFDMIQPMQKRLCDPETTDEDAQNLQKELQEIDGLQSEEIAILAKASTAEVVQDLAAQRNQQMDAIAQKYMGNPNINQMKLLDYDIAAMSSPQVADELILPQGYDPTVKAENVRQQIIESATIQVGESVPISPRDDDKEHLDVIVGQLKHAMPGLMQKKIDDPDLPQLLDNLNAALRHGDAHVAALAQKGGKNGKQAAAPYQKFFDEAEKNLTKYAQALKLQSDKQQQMQQQQPPQGQPQMPQGAPNEAQPQDQGALPSQGGIPSDAAQLAAIYRYAPSDVQRSIESKLGVPPSQEAKPSPPVTQPATV